MEFIMEIRLCREALTAREKAYCPYSGFSVGAALLSKTGKIYTGCNMESAAYTPSICAERTAFAKAISEGEREFIAIAIAGGKQGEPPSEACPPCGVCRQVMAEFCDPGSFRILLQEAGNAYSGYTLEELLPQSFGPGNLKK